jgi:hypothetical protein
VQAGFEYLLVRYVADMIGALSHQSAQRPLLMPLTASALGQKLAGATSILAAPS